MPIFDRPATSEQLQEIHILASALPFQYLNQALSIASYDGLAAKRYLIISKRRLKAEAKAEVTIQ